MDRRHALTSCFLTALVLVCANAASAQIRRPARTAQFSELAACSDEAGAPSQEIQAARLSFVSYVRTESDCDAPSHELDFRYDQPPKVSPESLERDPIESQLRLIGAPGYVIAVVRQHVLAILRENNACSAWYAQAEPDPAKKFATLRFQTDSNGEATAVGEYTFYSVAFHEPFVARAQQEVGAGSTITLNSNGAFFIYRAPVSIRLNGGGPLIPQSRRQLHVGSYDGGSLNAQITTLLHEYGHIVGLLPVDRGEAGSALLSTQNTETVLDHCRRQIEASANRIIVIPVTLANLERARR